MKRLDQKGFTLIEVIIVLALFAILAAMAGYYMGGQGAKARLKSAARDLASDMILARTRAIRDTRPWAISFDQAENSYVIYSYAGENPADWTNGGERVFRTVSLPKNISFASNQTGLDGNPVTDAVSYIENVDPDGDDLVTFNYNGSSSESGEVYLTISTGETFCVSNLESTGRIKVQRNYGSGWSQ